MAFDLVSAGCVAAVSGYITLYLVSDSEPFINEDGEEEYTLSSYVKLGGAYVMKCALKKALGLIGYRPETKAVRNYDNVIMFNPNPVTEENETEDEHELVV